MSGQHYCLRWNNYQSNMTSVFHQLLQTESFVDVTLSCNDSSLRAHKVVLSACSSYFQKLLIQNPCNHPTIIMPSDISFNDLKVIIDFVYRGEIDVDQAQLQACWAERDGGKTSLISWIMMESLGDTTKSSLLRTADHLKIKGLCEVPDAKDVDAEAVRNFKGEINILGADFQSQPNQHVKAVNFENVVHSSGLKASYLPTELALNLPKLKSPTSSPIFSHEGFVPVKQLCETKTLQTAPVDNQNNLINKRNSVKRRTSPLVSPGSGRTSPSKKKRLNAESKKSPVLKDRAIQSDLSDNGMNLPQNGLEQITGVPSPRTGSISDPIRHEPQVWRWIQSNGERVPECITVATSTEEDQKNVPVVILEQPMTSMPMIVHNLPVALSPQVVVDPNNTKAGGHGAENAPPDVEIPPEAQPPAPSATLVENLDLTESNDQQQNEIDEEDNDNVKVKFETLRSVDQTGDNVDIESHISERNHDESDQSMQTMMITPELLGLLPSSSGNSVDGGEADGKGIKTWTQDDMELALDALRNHNMSLTKASATYGIPSTTLWQRAHRLGIDTPKKEGNSKNWTEDNLNSALEALRTGTISANKASKAFGIPSSTLYKIARREGIRLSVPFNAAPTSWTHNDLQRALASIRSGQTTVQRASTEFGIPTGTLYGRCKKGGIELSRSSTSAPWSENAMGEALEAVRVGHMSINQAAIHYNLPYSSLYGRFKRGKFEMEESNSNQGETQGSQMMLVNYQQDLQQYQQHTNS